MIWKRLSLSPEGLAASQKPLHQIIADIFLAFQVHSQLLGSLGQSNSFQQVIRG